MKNICKKLNVKFLSKKFLKGLEHLKTSLHLANRFVKVFIKITILSGVEGIR
jgi:hypothetical protein